MKILEIKNLCKEYGKGEIKVDALKNVSFDVEQGEFVAIQSCDFQKKTDRTYLPVLQSDTYLKC